MLGEYFFRRPFKIKPSIPKIKIINKILVFDGDIDINMFKFKYVILSRSEISSIMYIV